MKKPIALISTKGKTPEQIYEELHKSLKAHQDNREQPREDQSNNETGAETNT